MGPCRMCRRVGRLNDEDVVPRWLRSAIARARGTGFQLPPRALVPICESHNTSFARGLESPAAPIMSSMISGGPVELTPARQALLARWAMKTSLMTDLYSLEQRSLGTLPPGFERRPRDETVKALLALEKDFSALDDRMVVRVARLDPVKTTVIPRPVRPAMQSVVTGLATWVTVAFDLTLSDPTEAQWYLKEVAGEAPWHTLGLDAKPLLWPPSDALAPSEVAYRRRALGHTLPLGWDLTDRRPAREAAKRIQRIEVLTDDPHDGFGLADAMASHGFRANVSTELPSAPCAAQPTPDS
jgi:hypothetical protein